MQAKIAETERDTVESLKKGEMPAQFMKLMDKKAAAMAKAAVAAYKKEERVKSSGGPKNQGSGPKKNGHNQKEGSGRLKGKSRKRSKEN